MSDLKNDLSFGEALPDETEEKDPLASVNQLREENPEFRRVFDSLMEIMTDDEDEDAEEEYSFIGGIKEAFATIPENLKGIGGRLLDPLGVGDAQGEAEDEAEETAAAVGALRQHFPKGFHQVFSYLLFILLYVPCIAATGVVFREIGKLYGTIFVGYLTLLGWSAATI